MRLLDSTTLHLVSKADHDVSPYAILSHTWGSEDEEVTFQDMQELATSSIRKASGRFAHRITKKPGFAKIRDSAALAKSHGYKFIWIDTCCIDKTSSAELSEAINSMFRWYRDAAVCYTFLNDVGDTWNPEAPYYLRRELWESRWFTRGWTLQELIAPANVYFYSNNWTLLGTKLGDIGGLMDLDSGFPELLCDITGIDLGVLDGSLILDDLSVANKMKWAARRRTTRGEDIAYCLMGIFNVNMPLLYGEGQRAFMRLQEEILKVTDDHSIFAWTCPENDMLRYQLSGLLASSPAYFESYGDIKPLDPDPSRVSAPSTMTNIGLHVQLSLSKNPPGLQEGVGHGGNQRTDSDSGDMCYAILDCFPRSRLENGSWSYCSLAIQLMALGGDQYARLNAEKVFWVLWEPSGDAGQANRPGHRGEVRYIYVKQLPIYGLPDIVVSSDGDYSRNLVEAHPPRGWSWQTWTLKPEMSTDNSVLGVFRYGMMIAGEKVYNDVYVGISPGQRGPLSWHCWCFQKPLVMTAPSLKPMDGPMPSGIAAAERGRFPLVSDRHAHQNSVATVETVRLRNKTYIRLDVSHVHELGTDGEVGTQASVIPTGLCELAADEVDGNVAALRVLAADPVIKDLWESGIPGSEAQPDPPRILVLPRLPRLSRNQAPTEWIGWKSFAQVVGRAARADLQIDTADNGEGNAIQNYFSLLLVRACIKNDVEAAAELLDSPLSTAVIEARTSIAAKEAEPWHDTFAGFKPLHWACALGHKEAVFLLDKHDADISSFSGSGLSVIHLAALSGNLEIVEFLLDRTDHLESQWFDAYHRSEKAAHIVASYIRSGDVGAILEKLMSAKGSKQQVGKGFDLSADQAETSDDARWASDEAKAGSESDDAWWEAEDGKEDKSEQEEEDEEEEGIEHILNQFRETPLHRAAAMNNIHAARCILEQATDNPLASEDSSGRTPLWHAAAAGARDIVRLFLEWGAEVDAPDKVERTPLHAACRLGYDDVAADLIAAGADVNSVTREPGFTAFHFATLGDHPSVLRHLLRCGANLDRFQEVGSRTDVSPMHIAAANGFLECAKTLFDAGCSFKTGSEYLVIVNAPNTWGVVVTKYKWSRPAELAVLGSHAAVAHLLQASDDDW